MREKETLVIEFQNICYSYGEEEILQDISFSINKGECVGLTGPSGCGKSTLASIAAGYLIPTSGKVLIDGCDVTGKPGRDIFPVNQESDLFVWQTVEKHIASVMQKKDLVKIRGIVALVKLTGYEHYYPRELSVGMKKRLALARAIAINPKLLILDESFASLDSDLKTTLYLELKEIWEVIRTTILLITHDSKDVKHLAHREILLTKKKPTCIWKIKTL